MTDPITSAASFNTTILTPALAWFAANCPVPVTPSAQILILAIAGQEGGWTHRIQSGNGPAHGFWQFERMGGVNGVLTHPATVAHARHLCSLVPIPADAAHVWGLLATPKGDNLAAAFARLLLWSDPAPIPTTEAACWDMYARCWRPGKPRPGDWPGNYAAALRAVTK